MKNRPFESAGQWRGVIDLAPEWGLFTGTGGVTRAHAHPSQKLIVGLEPGTDVTGATRVGEQAWFVAAGTLHSIDASGRAVALLFLDAGGLATLDADDRRLGTLVALLREPAGDLRLSRIARFVEHMPKVRDRRVARAAALFRNTKNAAVGDIAAELKLSTTRLSHLFGDHVGASPRRYRTCGILRRALRLIGGGQPLLTVAQQAGFTDSAHLTHTFSALLGITPRALSKQSALRLHF